MFNARKAARKPLSRVEHLVMNYLWSQEEANAEMVREGLSSQHPMKDATVRTILRRLEEKGYVTHKVEGRTYIYRPLHGPDAVALGIVRQIVDRFWGGRLEPLIVGMVDNKVIDEDELKNLTEKIARRRKEKTDRERKESGRKE